MSTHVHLTGVASTSTHRLITGFIEEGDIKTSVVVLQSVILKFLYVTVDIDLLY